MNISNFGRLIGAGLLALGLHAFAPSATAQAFSSGLAFDGAFIAADNNKVTAPVPEPRTEALTIAGPAALWLISRRA
jgi:hypothetical protein